MISAFGVDEDIVDILNILRIGYLSINLHCSPVHVNMSVFMYMVMLMAIFKTLTQYASIQKIVNIIGMLRKDQSSPIYPSLSGVANRKSHPNTPISGQGPSHP